MMSCSLGLQWSKLYSSTEAEAFKYTQRKKAKQFTRKVSAHIGQGDYWVLHFPWWKNIEDSLGETFSYLLLVFWFPIHVCFCRKYQIFAPVQEGDLKCPSHWTATVNVLLHWFRMHLPLIPALRRPSHEDFKLKVFLAMHRGLVSKKSFFLKKRKIDIYYHWGESWEHYTNLKKPERESPKNSLYEIPRIVTFIEIENSVGASGTRRSPQKASVWWACKFQCGKLRKFRIQMWWWLHSSMDVYQATEQPIRLPACLLLFSKPSTALPSWPVLLLFLVFYSPYHFSILESKFKEDVGSAI